MFRVAVLSIVMTLAAGPGASLLCVLWCHPQAAAAEPCGHRGTTSAPGVTTNDGCPDISAGSTAFVREDLLRGVFTPQAQHAVVVPPFQFTPPSRHAALSRTTTQSRQLEARPLVLALRI